MRLNLQPLISNLFPPVSIMDAPQARATRPPLRVPRALGATFRSLESPAFARYWWGSTAFFFAMNMQIMLRGWLVYVLTKDTLALGLINASFAIPTLLASPAGGVVADRFNRRTVIVVSQTAQLVLTVITTALVLMDRIEFWHLLVISVLASTAGSFNMPARAAIVPELVGSEQLMNANALSSGSMNVSRIAAPALAGVLVAPIGIGGGFVVTLVFYTVAIVLFAGLKVGERGEEETRRSFMGEMVDGVRYLGAERVLLLLLLVGTIPMMLGMPLFILLPAFADVFHTGPAGVGVMQASAGLGGLAGALIAANMSQPRRPALLMTLTLVGSGVFIALFAVSPHLAPALVALAVGDAAAMLGMTLNNTVVQERVPNEVRGRVMSLMMMTFGLTPLAVLPAGAAARAFGVQATVTAAGVLLALFGVALYTLSRSFRSIDREEPAMAAPGPVLSAADD